MELVAFVVGIYPWSRIRPRRRMDYVSRLTRQLRRDMHDLERRFFRAIG
jgi:hypothetical protein